MGHMSNPVVQGALRACRALPLHRPAPRASAGHQPGEVKLQRTTDPTREEICLIGGLADGGCRGM